MGRGSDFGKLTPLQPPANRFCEVRSEQNTKSQLQAVEGNGYSRSWTEPAAFFHFYNEMERIFQSKLTQNSRRG